MHPGKLCVLLLVFASACTTVRVGRDFDLSAFDARVQRGVTTQTEVRDWLGAPAGVGVSVEASGERFEEWNYYYGAVRAYNWSGERG